jgi:hypothetical protein
MNDEDLRDLFAAMALQGMMARERPHDCKTYATAAYLLADAMIEAKYAEKEPEVGITAIKRKYTKQEK